MHDLATLQRWMQAVVMHPEGAAEGVASAPARQCLDVEPAEVEAVVTRSRNLSALDRLAIYNGAYHARLLECLREEFPVLVRAVGRDIFDAFAAGYLQQQPSRSYTLRQLGARFATYLAETRSQLSEGDGAWPDFLIDLATLEWTFSEVFDGPGVEGQPLLGAEQLRAVPPDRWPEARLVSVPCLRLLALNYPVDEYYAALRREEKTPPPQPANTFLAVTRRDYIVRYHRLAELGYELLQALAGGQPVGAAIERAAAASAGDLDRLASRLQIWFFDWAALGLFRAVKLEAEGESAGTSSRHCE